MQNNDIYLFIKQLLNLPNLYPIEHLFYNINVNCIPKSNCKYISYSVKFPYKHTSDDSFLKLDFYIQCNLFLDY